MANAIISPHNNKRGGKIDWIVPSFGSLNNKDDKTQIGEDQTPDTYNTIYDAVGATETRKGYIKLLTTSVPGKITGMQEFERKDGTKYLIFAAGDTGVSQYLYRYDNAGGSVQLGGPYSANTIWDFTVYQDKVFACNGVDGIYEWSATGSFTLTTSFAAQYLTTHRNRIIAAPKNASYIRFTDANNATSWPVNNVMEINTDDGQTISGLEKMTNSVKIFKTGSIWTLKGEPVGAGGSTVLGNLLLEQDDSDVGCISYRTIQRISQGVIIFMASSGLYVLQNNQASLISDFVEATFKSGMNSNQLSLCWGVYSPVEKKYLLGYPSAASSTPNEVIMVDVSRPDDIKFSLWNDFPGSCAITYKFTQQETVLVGHPTKGYIVEAFKGYADIAGANGTVTSATSTTLVDSTKAWTTNQFKDCYLYILEGTGRTQKATIASNTATTLTLEAAWSVNPDTTSVYTVGGYNSYRTTKPDNFRKPQMIKRYKYFSVFTDVKGDYDLRFGAAFDNGALEYEEEMSLNGGALKYDTAGLKYDVPGQKYDSRSKLFRRGDLEGVDRVVQILFGNNRANQPWRVSEYVITYKEKKSRAD